MKQVNIAGIIDHPIFCKGIKFHCEEIRNVNFIGNFNDRSIKEILQNSKIDLLFIKRDNQGLLNSNSRAFIKECKNAGCHAVIFLDTSDENIIRNYFEQGYKGIISAGIGAYELELAIKTILNDGFYVSQALSSNLFDAIVNPAKQQQRLELENSSLTRRETEIMQLICQELTNQKIARCLSISPRTVEVHRLNIIRKLGVKNSIGIVKFAIRNEMVVS